MAQPAEVALVRNEAHVIGTVPGAVATGRLAEKAFRWGPVATAPGTVPIRVLPNWFAMSA